MPNSNVSIITNLIDEDSVLITLFPKPCFDKIDLITFLSCDITEL